MRKTRFTDEQIVGFLKQVRGRPAGQGAVPQGWLQRRHFYKWRARFGGMEAQHARMLRVVQAENTKLTKLLAEAPWTSKRSRLASG
jgi:putative transposase